MSTSTAGGDVPSTPVLSSSDSNFSSQPERRASITQTPVASVSSQPRRASLLSQGTNSPARPFPTSASSSPAQPLTGSSHSRKTSFTGHKPLSLETRSVTNASPVTPRRTKRMSLSYIPSPTTSSVKASPVPLASTASTSAVTGVDSPRSGSLSRSTSITRPSPAPVTSSSASTSSISHEPGHTHKSASDAGDDWLMSDDEDAATGSFSVTQAQASRSMAERDSAKVEAQFHDVSCNHFPSHAQTAFLTTSLSNTPDWI